MHMQRKYKCWLYLYSQQWVWCLHQKSPTVIHTHWLFKGCTKTSRTLKTHLTDTHTHTNVFHWNVWNSRYLIHWKYHYQFILIVWTYFDVMKYFYPTFIFITFLKAYLQSLDSLNSPIIKVNKKPWRRY